MSLVEHLLASRSPLELAKELSAIAKRNAALEDKVDALQHELFWSAIDAKRYRHIRDTRYNGYPISSEILIGNWHIVQKVKPGEGEYLFGERLDKRVDQSIQRSKSDE